MNLNGKKKNGTLGAITACREQIAAANNRAHSSPQAAWLLNDVDPVMNEAALLALISNFNHWAHRLESDMKENWLMWAFTKQPHRIRTWLGYNGGWSMIPAGCKGKDDVVRLSSKSGLPQLYLVPCGGPRDKDSIGRVEIGGYKMQGVALKTVTYVLFDDQWYKAYPAKKPSETAIARALRLFALSVLLDRMVSTSTELKMYELDGIKSWLIYGNSLSAAGIAEKADNALTHLVADPLIFSDFSA